MENDITAEKLAKMTVAELKLLIDDMKKRAKLLKAGKGASKPENSSGVTFCHPTRFRFRDEWIVVPDRTWRELYGLLLRRLYAEDSNCFRERVLSQRRRLPWFAEELEELGDDPQAIYLDFCGYYAYAKLSAEAIVGRLQDFLSLMALPHEVFEVEVQ